MDEALTETVRSLRIIVAGMMGGLLAFALLAAIVGPVSRHPDPEMSRILFVIVALLAAGCVVGYTLLRRSLIESLVHPELSRDSDASAPIVGPYRSFVVRAAGLFNGMGFFLLVTYLVTGNRLAFAAAGLAVAAVAAHLPFAGTIRRLEARAARSAASRGSRLM